MNNLILHSVAETGIFDNTSDSDQSRIRVINSTCIIGLFITISSNIYLYTAGEFYLSTFLVFCAAFIVPILANRYSFYTLARLAIYTGGLIAISLTMIDSPDKIIYFTIPIIVIPYFFHEKEYRVIFFTITLSLPFIIIWYYNINIYQAHQLRPVFFIITFVTSMMMLKKFIEIRSEKLQQNIVLLNDVNVQKNYLAAKEESINDINMKLSVQNAELENFVYIASHDLKQPIRNTISYVQLLKRKLANELNEEQVGRLENLESNAVRINGLITRLLIYSRIGKNASVTSFDFEGLISDVEKEVKSELETEFTLKLNSNIKLTARREDVKLLFKEYIFNVLENNKDKTDLEIFITVDTVEDYFNFTIEDNGVGIPEDKIELAQTMFTSLDELEESTKTGVGLAITNKILSQHGGKQCFSKSEKGGLCVSFSFDVSKFNMNV